MRKILWTIGLMWVAAGVRAETPRAVHPVKKVLIAALSKDSARAGEIELSLRDHIQERSALAAPLHGVFTSTVPVSEMIQQMTAEGYDALLCIAPRKTIHFENSGKPMSHMKDCLTMYATGKFPTGEPLNVYPLTDEQGQTAAGNTGNTGSAMLQTPMSVNGRAAPLRVSKGTLRLFEVPSGKLLWEKNVHVKVPADAKDTLANIIITRALWDALSQSGAFPK